MYCSSQYISSTKHAISPSYICERNEIYCSSQYINSPILNNLTKYGLILDCFNHQLKFDLKYYT